MPTVTSTEEVLRLQTIVSEKDAEIAHLKALLAANAATTTSSTTTTTATTKTAVYADSATITLTNTIASTPTATATDTLAFASPSPSSQSMQQGTVLADNGNKQSATYVQKLRGEVKEATLTSTEDSSH